jgi:glycosyltransferase involved in cell wall biosynthesis
LPYTILPEKIDLDDPNDLRMLLRTPPRGYPRTNLILKTLDNGEPLKEEDKISVIIPTLNERKTIGNTIQSIRAQLPPVEIIVVDGGSRDGTLQIANQLADRVVIASAQGRQHQENVGARGAKGDILLFLHADAVISSTFLQSIRSTCQDPTIVLGGAHLAYSSPQRFRYRALCILRESVSKMLGISGIVFR